MKVLVHLNHGVDKSYLLNFGRKLTKKDVVGLVKGRGGESEAAQTLFNFANIADLPKTEIRLKNRPKAVLLADYTLSQHGYPA